MKPAMAINMTQENKVILVNRLKSLAWRVGNASALLALNFLAENVGLFNLPPVAVLAISLITAEVTKWLNTR